MMWGSWWMYLLVSPVLITVGRGVKWHVLLCMCCHLLLQHVCLMSTRWAYTPLFYRFPLHSVRRLLRRTWVALCLHVPNCYGCVFFRLSWLLLASCLLEVAKLSAWLPCIFRTWHFAQVAWCLQPVSCLQCFDCVLCQWWFATLPLCRLWPLLCVHLPPL